MIEIDGSHGEGGGQLLRMAVALSALTRRDVTVTRIRQGRPNPGLAPQHVTALRAVAELASAEVTGLEAGSSRIGFRPGDLRGGEHHFDVGTAGSITLILQALMPAAAFASKPVEVEITGGTDVPMAPSINYLKNVTIPMLK